jgi:hypothetical protein
MISKLKLWTDEGYKELDRFLVRLSIPLNEAKQKYQFMGVCRYSSKLKHKQNLPLKIAELSGSARTVNEKHNETDFSEISIASFIKVGSRW